MYSKDYSVDGECILHELVEGDGDDVEQSTSQQQQQHEDIGIDVSSPSHPDEQSLSCLSNENSLPYQSLTNGFLSLSMSSPGRDLTYHNQLSHGSEKSDSDSYYDCNSSFSGRTNMLAYGYMPEPNFHPRSQPSSLPGKDMSYFIKCGLTSLANRGLINTCMLSCRKFHG